MAGKLSEKSVKNILQTAASSTELNLSSDTLKELAKVANMTEDSIKRDYEYYQKEAGTYSEMPAMGFMA